MTESVQVTEATKEERRAKLSAALKAAWAKPEVRAKISGDNNATKRPEVRAKISVALKAAWSDPIKSEVMRKKISETARFRREKKLAAQTLNTTPAA